jgi:hypothetical protein
MFDANSMLGHSVKVLAIFDSLAELTLRCFVVHRPRAGAVSVYGSAVTLDVVL